MPTQIDACIATLEMILELQKEGVKDLSSLKLAVARGKYKEFPTYQKALEKHRAKNKKGKADEPAPDGAKKAPEGDWVRVLKKEKPKDSKPAALSKVPPNEGGPGALRVVKKVTTYYEKKKA